MKSLITILVVCFLACDTIQADAVEPSVYKARRAAVMAEMAGGVAVLYGKTASGAGVVNGQFIQESNFYYLTGISESGAALILAPGESIYKEILYLQPRNPEYEDWNGRRPPLGDALEERLGFEEVRRTSRLPADVSAMLQRSKKAVFLGPIVSAAASVPSGLSLIRDAQKRVPESSLVNMAELIPELRRIKSVQEIAQIQRAIDITGEGIVAAMQAVQPGMLEFQLQSIVEHSYKTAGAQFLGFSTILAAGPNATVLHYQGNDRPIQNSGLVLIDTGAAWQHYSADISRTFPVNGKFSAREKELYELVLKAANAAIKNVRVGASYYEDVHLVAKAVLDEAGYGEYFIHGTGHFVGLDVHDAGDYDKPLKAGVVITVEPGIYIPEEGIGIRIEDDVLVTKKGPRVLSRDIPRTVEEIEALMAAK